MNILSGFFKLLKAKKKNKENRLKFELYLTCLRFLTHKITVNLRKLYLDIDLKESELTITAFYNNYPTEVELELLDDIVTNTNAHLPYHFVVAKVKLMSEMRENEKHDFSIFEFYEGDYGW